MLKYIFLVTFLLVLTGCDAIKKMPFIAQDDDEIENVEQIMDDSSVQKLSDDLGSGSVVKFQKTGNCTQEYEQLFDYNKADFSDCKITARSADPADEVKVPEKQNNVVVIFDASGSMAAQIDGKAKIDIAKEAAYRFIDKVNGTKLNMSIVLYGHKGSNSTSDKVTSCTGIEEAYFMGPVHVAAAKSKITPLRSTGWTPIASAFKKAQEILAPYDGDNDHNAILLISDGKETCDGDPIEVARELKNSNSNVEAHVIGFDVSGTDEQQLKEIAMSGGGEYYSVKNITDFDEAFAKYLAFLAKFDSTMSHLTNQLDDVILIGNTYFECFSKLKQEESQMILDIYADEISSSKCATEIETMYYKHYDNMSKILKQNYEDGRKDWENKQ